MSVVGIIPCFDVENFCADVIEKALQYVDWLVVIDDGSKDKTPIILETLAKKYSRIKLILCPVNRGKGFVLLEAMQYALEHYSCQVLVTLDSDGQHDPKEILGIAQKVKEGADLVIGERDFKKMPFRNKLANRFMCGLLKAIHKTVFYDTQSGFRGFSQMFARTVLKEVRGGRYETEMACIVLALQMQKKVDT